MARDHLRTTGESWDKPLLQAQQQRFLQRMRRSALELSGHGANQYSEGFDNGNRDIQALAPTGTSVEAALRRLRDAPEIM